MNTTTPKNFGKKDFLLSQVSFYSWLHTTMKDNKQGNPGVLAMHEFRLSLNVDNWNMKSLWLNITEKCLLQVFYNDYIVHFIVFCVGGSKGSTVL